LGYGYRLVICDGEIAVKSNVTPPPDDPVSLAGEGFVDVVEAGEFLGLSRAKLYQLMDAGELRFAKFGKSRRIPRLALIQYAERCLVGGE
jgi:excisionase family DNA binding protein